MADLSLKNIYKKYPGGTTAVTNFSLDVDDKEFIAIVGPSGCGKSTILRIIAGLEDISDGDLYIGGQLMNDVAPKDRDIAMVFQDCALFPHMTVFENMAFGLRLGKTPKDEIERRVEEAASILDIIHLLKSSPDALSSGQHQRAALGRAVVRRPRVFLLDEPLSNLDEKLRAQMRVELSKIHKKLGATFIYVTHDQVEAMAMGTRIVVMKDGTIQQVDNPANLYSYPCNLFVAGFMGTPPMNLVEASIQQKGSYTVVCFGNETQNHELVLSEAKAEASKHHIGREVIAGIRPEDVHDNELFSSATATCIVDAVVEVSERVGAETYLHTVCDNNNLVARVSSQSAARCGDHVRLAIDPSKVHLFDKETEQAITN